MTAQTANATTTKRINTQWLAPAGLILLSLIPILAGAARLTELTGGAVSTPANARFLNSPVPIVTHIVSVTIYSLIGAFQFVPALRGRRGWHRLAGRVLIPAGLVAALSGLWMAIFYPHAHGFGDLMLVFRLVFGSAMIVSIILGIRAIIRRDFAAHGAWMTRGYAIAMGAGTQALILIPGSIIFGTTQNVPGAILFGLAWIINLAIAERVIRARASHIHQPTRKVSS